MSASVEVELVIVLDNFTTGMVVGLVVIGGDRGFGGVEVILGFGAGRWAGCTEMGGSCREDSDGVSPVEEIGREALERLGCVILRGQARLMIVDWSHPVTRKAQFSVSSGRWTVLLNTVTKALV
jgi:hypothetical protein